MTTRGGESRQEHCCWRARHKIGAMEFLSIIIPVLAYAIGVGVMYFVIQTAVVAAQRRARREQFVEDYVPELATWLSAQQREQLRAHADATGKKTPVK